MSMGPTSEPPTPVVPASVIPTAEQRRAKSKRRSWWADGLEAAIYLVSASGVALVIAAGGFTSRLDSREQQGHQHADDGDHHEQLDQRKGQSCLSKTREPRHCECLLQVEMKKMQFDARPRPLSRRKNRMVVLF